MRRSLTILILLTVALEGWTQSALEYKMELGGLLGSSFYMGDVNKSLYKNSGLSGGAIARFLLNPRMAVKTTLSYAQLKGTTTDVDQFYPEDPESQQTGTTPRSYSFNAGVYDLSGTFEYNFLPYGIGGGYLGYSRISPYIQIGLGFTYAEKYSSFTLNVPIGLGVKYKIAPRLNIGLDWAAHFTLSDKLDGMEAPHGIESSGFKNKDFYIQTQVFLTYDLFPKCLNCNKD